MFVTVQNGFFFWLIIAHLKIKVLVLNQARKHVLKDFQCTGQFCYAFVEKKAGVKRESFNKHFIRDNLQIR